MRCQLYIARLHGSEEGKAVRIDARDGTKLLGRIELSVEQFALAVMGVGAVPAEFSNERARPKPETGE